MAATASRWRLIELRRSRDAVRAGVDLLDRKREGLTRELVQRADEATRRRAGVQVLLEAARTALVHAMVDVGPFAAEAAALAQPPLTSVEVTPEVVIGVRLPRMSVRSGAFQITYGPGSTSLSLDDAAARFAEALPAVLDMAAEEAAVARLRAALQRTTRILNALETVMLPQLDADIAAVAAVLEEDDRDERIRRLRATASVRAPAREGTTARGPAG